MEADILDDLPEQTDLAPRLFPRMIGGMLLFMIGGAMFLLWRVLLGQPHVAFGLYILLIIATGVMGMFAYFIGGATLKTANRLILNRKGLLFRQLWRTWIMAWEDIDSMSLRPVPNSFRQWAIYITSKAENRKRPLIIGNQFMTAKELLVLMNHYRDDASRAG